MLGRTKKDEPESGNTEEDLLSEPRYVSYEMPEDHADLVRLLNTMSGKRYHLYPSLPSIQEISSGDVRKYLIFMQMKEPKEYYQ